MEASDQISSCGRSALRASPRCLSVVGLLVCVGAVWWSCTSLWAQRTITGRGKNFVAPVTDAQGHKTILRGQDFKPGRPGTVEIDGMQAETFKGDKKDMIVQAPQCLFEPKSNVANSEGTLTIRTADQRFSIEGRGFRWQLGDSRLTSKLVISNAVHSLVEKRQLDTKAGPPQVAGGAGTPGPARGTNAVSSASGSRGTNQFVEVTSDQFEYAGDVAVYRGHVHVKDEQGKLNCGAPDHSVYGRKLRLGPDRRRRRCGA